MEIPKVKFLIAFRLFFLDGFKFAFGNKLMNDIIIDVFNVFDNLDKFNTEILN
jgi:hypothetical protein